MENTDMFSSIHKALLLFLATLALLLIGCGPVYKTDYSFTPPKTDSGRACVFQCENNKLQCRQIVQLRHDSCEQQSETNYYLCESSKRYRYDSKGKQKCIENCYCYRETCSEEYEPCDEQYRGCYQTCGGEVSSRTYCVSNCEKAGPPPQ
jgi:hypothetical protein